MQRKEIKHGWRAAFAAATLAVMAGSAMAQQGEPGWWWNNDNDTTRTCYQFFEGSGNPDYEWNPFGPSQLHSIDNVFARDLLTDHEWVVGTNSNLGPGSFKIFVPNQARPNWVKECWVQVDYYESGTGDFWGTVESDPGSQFQETYRNIEDIGGGWVRETLAFTIFPQPGFEEWTFNFDPGTNGEAWMDNFYFGTHCTPVPEPASFAALGLGALALMRRRK